jgi:hypothetical protein
LTTKDDPIYVLSFNQAMLIVQVRVSWCLTRLTKRRGEVITMGLLKEKGIKAYRLKTNATEAAKVVAEDVIHDQVPTVCVRCALLTKRRQLQQR